MTIIKNSIRAFIPFVYCLIYLVFIIITCIEKIIIKNGGNNCFVYQFSVKLFKLGGQGVALAMESVPDASPVRALKQAALVQAVSLRSGIGACCNLDAPSLHVRNCDLDLTTSQPLPDHSVNVLTQSDSQSSTTAQEPLS